MKKNLFVLPLIAVFALSSCGVGTETALSGKLVEKSFEVSGTYSVLEVSSAVDVLYSSSAEKVTVTADSVVMPLVLVENKGNSLSISIPWKQNMRFRSGDLGKVSVVVPASSSLEKLRISGASDFESDDVIRAGSLSVEASGASDFKADISVTYDLSLYAGGASDIVTSVSAETLDVRASGASDVYVQGKVDSYMVHASGASTVSSGQACVETGNLKCDISGASGCHVACSGTAEGSVSGASSIVVYGNGQVNISSSGASSVHRK